MRKLMNRGFLALVAYGVLMVPHVAGAQSEGIKVKGHWTIDVRNPDGTLVTHQEFDNALLTNTGESSGHAILARLLMGSFVPGKWHIYLSTGSNYQTGANAPCASSALIGTITGAVMDSQPAAGQRSCIISEVGSPSDIAQIGTLTTSTVGAAGGAVQFVLTGTATATQAGEIRQVATTLSPANAPGVQTAFPISGTVLPQVTEVVAGQIVQVTVRLSFQ